MADIYDGVFRTILNDCRQLILPLINEIFEENYAGDETIEFYPNEHFIDQLDEPDKKRITDTNFTVIKDLVSKKYHLECESSLPDGRMTIRLFEYDAQIALDEGTVVEETLTVTFPHTAVLYLRNYSKTPDQMWYVIITPGGTVRYRIPIMKVQTYSIDEIFEKRLLLLIPFYMFIHEKDFEVYNSNDEKLAQLKREWRGIIDRLNQLEQQGIIGAYDKRTILDLSKDVIKELTKKYGRINQEVGDLMRGAMIETEARRLRNEGIREGFGEGFGEGLQQGESLLAKLFATLFSLGRDSDAKRAATDEKARQELYREFGMIDDEK